LRLDAQDISAPIQLPPSVFGAAGFAHALRDALRYRAIADVHIPTDCCSTDHVEYIRQPLRTHTALRITGRDVAGNAMGGATTVTTGAPRDEKREEVDRIARVWDPYRVQRVRRSGGEIAGAAKPWAQIANLWISEPREQEGSTRVTIVGLGAFPMGHRVDPRRSPLHRSTFPGHWEPSEFSAVVSITNVRMESQGLSGRTEPFHQSSTGSGVMSIAAAPGDLLRVTVSHQPIDGFAEGERFSTLIRVPPSTHHREPQFTRATHVDGLLMRGSSGVVYVVDGGARYAVPTGYSGLGYVNDQVSTVDDSTLSALPEGDWADFIAGQRGQ
jgi:hypothetical protein